MKYSKRLRKERKTRNRLLRVCFRADPRIRSEYEKAIEFEESDTDDFHRPTFYYIIANEIVNTFMQKEYHQALVYNYLSRKQRKFDNKNRRLITIGNSSGGKVKLYNSKHILLRSIVIAFNRKAKFYTEKQEIQYYSILKNKCQQKD